MGKGRWRIAGYLAAIAVLGGLFTGLNWMSLHLFPEDAAFLGQIDTTWRGMPKAEAITIGGSTAASIDFAELGQRGLASYWGGTDSFETEALLALMLPRAQALRTVFLPVDPVMLAADNAHRAAGRRRAYYRALAKYGQQGLIGGDWRNALIAWYLPLVRADRWQPPLRHVIGPAAVPAPSSFVSTATDSRTAEAWMTSDIAKRSLLMTKKLRDGLYRHPDIPLRVAGAMGQIQDQLSTRGIQLVLFEPPVTAAYLREVADFTAQFQEDFDALMENARRRGAIVVSYRAHPLFVQRYDLFKDANHLNPDGARLFSRLLRADIDAALAAR